MTTYRQFLIHPNLRCYLDHNGRLTPMFINTEFGTLEQLYARIDKYWQEAEQFELQRSVNLGKAWEMVSSDEDGRERDAEDFANKVEAYYENELNQDR